jgi:chorismate mutase/prephenate dehydratase
VSRIEDLREQIDRVDDAILEALSRRASLVGQIGEAKQSAGIASAHDPVRERAILDRVAQKGAGDFPRESIAPVFREIMSGCLLLEQPITVAFLGPAATFSHAAAQQIFGLGARYRETTTIHGVFDAVLRKDANFGVVPVENSSEGAVPSTMDSLVESNLSIRQEFILDVVLCLLSKASGLTSIERVYSHHQPLGQSRIWLARHLPNAQIIQTASTTTAAREAANDPAAAAVASRLAAEMVGIPILREGIQDRADNATRFFVLAHEDAPPTGRDKTSLAFSLPDAAERGSLRRALEIFDRAGLNMTRIESRPRGRHPWEYFFFVDLEGHRTEPTVAGALDALRERCDMVKVLGSYERVTPAARRAESEPPTKISTR